MSVLELEQEDVAREGRPPMVCHLSIDPAKKIALCGTRLLGIPAREPFVRCVVCFDLWAAAR